MTSGRIFGLHRTMSHVCSQVLFLVILLAAATRYSEFTVLCSARASRRVVCVREKVLAVLIRAVGLAVGIILAGKAGSAKPGTG